MERHGGFLLCLYRIRAELGARCQGPARKALPALPPLATFLLDWTLLCASWRDPSFSLLRPLLRLLHQAPKAATTPPLPDFEFKGVGVDAQKFS